MNERNEQMAAMLAAVPSRDVGFEIAVLAKIEQRRFRRALTRNVLVAMGVTVLLALVVPQLGLDFSGWSAALAGLAGNIPVMLGLLIAVSAAWHYRPRANV